MNDVLHSILDYELPLRRTPFARLFTETNTPHRFEKEHEYNELPVCARCGGFEGGLLATCPIQHMTFAESEIAYDAFITVSAIFHEELNARRSAGMEGDAAEWWTRPFSPTIAEYNEAARKFNDNLIDLTMKQKELAAVSHAGNTSL